MSSRRISSQCARYEDARAAPRPDVGLDLPTLVLEDIADDNPGALAGEEPGLSGPHAASAAADQSYLPGEPHVVPHLPGCVIALNR